VLYSGHMTEEALGVIMGMVAGIMVFIAVRELIPRALLFDPHGHVVSWSIMVGMGIMAVSLIMLAYFDKSGGSSSASITDSGAVAGVVAAANATAALLAGAPSPAPKMLL